MRVCRSPDTHLLGPAPTCQLALSARSAQRRDSQCRPPSMQQVRPAAPCPPRQAPRSTRSKQGARCSRKHHQANPQTASSPRRSQSPTTLAPCRFEQDALTGDSFLRRLLRCSSQCTPRGRHRGPKRNAVSCDLATDSERAQQASKGAKSKAQRSWRLATPRQGLEEERHTA